MKKLIFILLLIPVFSYAQDAIYNGKKPKHYTKIDMAINDASAVILIGDVSADELFSRGRLLITEMFRSAKDVTQLTDKSSHTLMAKGIFRVHPHSGIAYRNEHVNFTLMIQTKDGKYRYVIKDLTYKMDVNGYPYPLANGRAKGMGKRKWGIVIAEAKENVNEMIAEIKKYMAGKAEIQKAKW